MGDTKKISDSVDVLITNLSKIASVYEWAQFMGYSCPKKFARHFLRCYSVRPQTYLKYIRLKNILEDLRKSNQSNFEIARKYGVLDEIALNKYIKYHLDCSPTEVKFMEKTKIEQKIEKFGSKVRQ